MNTMIRAVVSSAALSLTLGSAQAQVNPMSHTHSHASAGAGGGSFDTAIQNPLGVPVALDQADRTIHVNQQTRWVNVTRMESVRFVVGDGNKAKTFAWRFDGVPQRPFALDRIAPAGAMGTQSVTVYVSRNANIDGS